MPLNCIFDATDNVLPIPTPPETTRAPFVYAVLAVAFVSDTIPDASMVVTADIECSNGVIHVIDTVLMPH